MYKKIFLQIVVFSAVLFFWSLIALPSAHAAIALVQSTSAQENNITNVVTSTFSSATTNGNFIIVAVSAYTGGSDSPGTITATDNKGNTYRSVGAASPRITSGNGLVYLFYAFNIAGGNNHEVRVQVAHNPTYLTAAIAEFSGVQSFADPLDAASGAVGGSTTALSGNVTTASAGELFFADETNDANATFTAPSPFTALANITTGQGIGSEYAILGATTTRARFPLSASTNWGVILATFKAAVPVPTITSFTATPAILTTGATSTVSWATTNASSVAIDNGIGSVGASGTTVVSPTSTTAYTLTATNAAGQQATSTVTIIVDAVPVITSFTATPVTVTAGSTSTLVWTSTGGATASIDHGIGSVGVNSSVAVAPTSTTTYHLALANAAGSTTTASATVTVVTSPVITSFTATPSTITVGASSTLVWGSTGATSASISHGIGSVATSGTAIVAPTSTTSYLLTISNTAGSATTTAVTIIVDAVPVITSFTATPVTVTAGSTSTLVWTSTGGATASIDHGIGSVGVNSSVAVAPTSTTTYHLALANAAGSTTTAARTITVVAAPATASNPVVHVPGSGSGAICTTVDTTTTSSTSSTSSNGNVNSSIDVSVPAGQTSVSQDLLRAFRELVLTALDRGIPVSHEACQLAGLPQQPYKADFGFGSSHSDVDLLQTFLIQKNTGPAAAALGRVGATGFFGSLTRAALAEYQRAAGITPASGFFGPKTRAFMNKDL